MEKVKFGTSVFDLVPNGVSFGEDQAQIIFVKPDTMAYEEIEAAIKSTDKIIVVDSEGDTMEARSGYTYLDSLAKKNDYIVAAETEGEDTADVTATVMIAVLKKSDIRQQIADIEDTLDMLIMDSLGGDL